MTTRTRREPYWAGNQLGDMPRRRRTDREPFRPENPLATLCTLIVMLFAVIGVVAVADHIASGWKR